MKLSAPAETGDESPVTSFVQLERYNAIRLVQIVHASLSSLSKVIRGTALLDAEVQALAGALLKQEVSHGSKEVMREAVEFVANVDQNFAKKKFRPFEGNCKTIFTLVEKRNSKEVITVLD